MWGKTKGKPLYRNALRAQEQMLLAAFFRNGKTRLSSNAHYALLDVAKMCRAITECDWKWGWHTVVEPNTMCVWCALKCTFQGVNMSLLSAFALFKVHQMPEQPKSFNPYNCFELLNQHLWVTGIYQVNLCAMAFCWRNFAIYFTVQVHISQNTVYIYIYTVYIPRVNQKLCNSQ